MQVKILRYRSGPESVQGTLIVDELPIAYTLERPDLDNRRGVSCIPAGSYTLGTQQELTPLTTQYRNRYDWFTHHLHIKDVPGRDNIYIHVGNKPTDVNGCVCVGIDPAYDWVSHSRKTFEKVYKAIYNELPCTIEIIDVT